MVWVTLGIFNTSRTFFPSLIYVLRENGNKTADSVFKFPSQQRTPVILSWGWGSVTPLQGRGPSVFIPASTGVSLGMELCFMVYK